MAAPPPPVPALMDELIEECLLRLPPDDPESLVRAALVCKGWCRIVTDRGFGRRFRELHGWPPMLGFLHIHTRYGSFFTPTASSRARNVNAYLHLGGWHAIDSRHGRVLLSTKPSLSGTWYERRHSGLAVWDPVSDDRLDLPELPPPHAGWLEFTSKAAVLCASSSACDHLDCHRGHFLVVLMDASATYDEVCVYVYSSQAGAWSHRTSAAQDHSPRLLHRQPVLMAGNVLYFSVHKETTNGILKYDMGAHEVSWVDLPLDCSSQLCRTLLTTTEHGGLGIVRVEKNSRLHLWEDCPNGVLGWAPTGVIELEAVLPADSGAISTIAFVQCLGALFIMTNAGAFTVDLVSNRVRKVVCGKNHVNYLISYTSFCTPALGAAITGEEPTAGVPSA